MCDQAWTAAMCWWTELEEIAFSQEMGICAEVKFTYPSTTHQPPLKAPYSVYQKHREIKNIECYSFSFQQESGINPLI